MNRNCILYHCKFLCGRKMPFWAGSLQPNAKKPDATAYQCCQLCPFQKSILQSCRMENCILRVGNTATKHSSSPLLYLLFFEKLFSSAMGSIPSILKSLHQTIRSSYKTRVGGDQQNYRQNTRTTTTTTDLLLQIMPRSEMWRDDNATPSFHTTSFWWKYLIGCRRNDWFGLFFSKMKWLRAAGKANWRLLLKEPFSNKSRKYHSSSVMRHISNESWHLADRSIDVEGRAWIPN